MRKKTAIVLSIVLALSLVLGLGGCGSSSDTGSKNAGSSGGSTTKPAEEKKEPLDLTGTWKQDNANDPKNYQEAVITGDTIEINWIAPDSKSLYWAGTYVPPTTSDDSYTWESKNDTAKTENAMLASTAPTKKFTYKDGELSYEASAMGTTVTIRMKKQ